MPLAVGFFVSFLLFLLLGLLALVVTAALDRPLGKERALLLWAFALLGVCFLLRPVAPGPVTPRPKPLQIAVALDPTGSLEVNPQTFARKELPSDVRNAFEEQSDTHSLPPERLAEPPDTPLSFPIA